MFDAIDKHGEMTLREVADRLGVSYVRIKQIQDGTLKKIGHLLRQKPN
jgi:DNA-directed RNA polymerase sigma subunit (sigma70/sigma32)